MEPQVLRTSENKTFLSEKFLMDKAILPLVKESIIIIDVNCTILLINESAQLLIRSIIGNTYEISDCLYAMPLGDASVFRDHLHTSLHGESTSFEQHIISEDNGFWISCSFMPLRIQDQVSGVSILIEDVSLSKKLEEEEQKRKKAEEASHISRVMFELFVENAPLRAWITDISGNVLFMNQQYLNAFGFDKSKLGSNLFDLFPESLVMNYIREIRKVHKTQLISETISQGFRDDGTKGYFKISRFPMKSAGQDMVGGWA
nr:PAS domain S-box protein [Flavisolibacter sp.]